MRSSPLKTLAVTALMFSAQTFAAPTRDRRLPEWLGSELPLQLPVHTPQDLQFKTATERQYLIFNLMAAGKVAWDAGDYATAADKWETLLKTPGLDPQIDAAVRPFAVEARVQAGKVSTSPAAPPVVAPLPPPAEPPHESAPPRRRTASVDGVVSGGGSIGPGGTVITLHRTDGNTPKPPPLKERVILQRDKSFLPHVIALPVGTNVVFRNAEEERRIYHDVFSLSPGARFDTGLYEAPGEKTQLFDHAGVVQLLCNIHAKMSGYVDVVDTPWFAQADSSGAFHIAGVPPGEYDLEAWHELAARTTRERITVPREGLKVALTVGGDRAQDPNPPDKYGKPRQEHLGY